MGPRRAVTAGLHRRQVLIASLALAGCGAAAPALPPGGWLGDSAARGHRLRDPMPATVDGPPRRCDVAVVGAGVAGLAAARALRQAGIDDLRLFDLEDEAGGNARGHRMGGMDCPLGAHYLPLPGPQAHEVQALLHELGLLRSTLGRTVPDERHLCHSPQERLWLGGPWQEGLLPAAAPGSARERQYHRFSQRVAEVSRELAFAMPTQRAAWTPGHDALDGQTFHHWLAAEGFDDPALRGYLDYVCRDDYGADARAVSAWAGLHYFASRHGFAAPGESDGAEPVFTWPEGNAWLTRRLTAPLGERLRTGALVRRVEVGRHGATLQVAAADGSAAVERWQARQVVMAVPLHVAARVLATPPPALHAAAARNVQAPWLVANLQLREPLTDKPGAPPSWDNVLQGDGPSLGYVDAMHQSLRPAPGPTVLTTYWALGHADPATALATRRALLEGAWGPWAQRVLADLARAHPDLPRKTARIDLMRYGHAMAVPVPGLRGDPARRALATPGAGARLHFAHADLAGYSVFEEAFTLGDQAGRAAAASLRAADSAARRPR